MCRPILSPEATGSRVRLAEMADFERRQLFGLDFLTGTTIPEITEALLDPDLLNAPGSPWRCVVTPNVDHLVRYDRHPAERLVAEHSFMVLPDGMPIIWASRLLRRSLDHRLAGSDLFAHMWPLLVARNIPAVIVAPDQRVAELLCAQHPGLAAVVAPMFDVGDDLVVEGLVDQILTATSEARARLLFIGVSMPKHHLLASHLEQRWASQPDAAPVVLLVGASPEFHLGLARRAPVWMQKCGLEWFHRLLMNPRKMGKRYLIDDTLFFKLVWREFRSMRESSRAAPR
jgi:N-acetylglucosaminyldiphosphoundecaprenol N-acetyl-beta-D-mannosaminyltransferase